MNDVTRLLEQIGGGEGAAAEQLLPLVYDELRRLASMNLARESPDQTLQPTDLVHEAYLRLVDVEQAQRWDNRRHFFAAAAEAMRRILIEAARRWKILPRVPLDSESAARAEDDRWFLLADALTTLAELDPTAAQVAQLRLLGGLSIEEIGQQIGLSRATAYREWDFARAWLVDHLSDQSAKKSGEP
jgi:RNA polymerase sigma factor (TIGR02999 family)